MLGNSGKSVDICIYTHARALLSALRIARVSYLDGFASDAVVSLARHCVIYILYFRLSMMLLHSTTARVYYKYITAASAIVVNRGKREARVFDL